MVIFPDTNVMIDYFDEREFSAEAAVIFDYCSKEENQGIIASLSLSTFFYVFRRKLSVQERKDDIRQLAALFTIGTVDRSTVETALSYDMDDYEDALQAACAFGYSAEYIVTNNTKDFINSPIPVITPLKFVEKYIE